MTGNGGDLENPGVLGVIGIFARRFLVMITLYTYHWLECFLNKIRIRGWDGLGHDVW